MKNSFFKAVLLLLALAPLPAFALSVPVAEDIATSTVTKIQLLKASSGKSTILPVNIGQKALVRFNLNDLDVVPAPIKPGNIKSAVLRFYIISARPTGPLHVRSIDSAWSELFATSTATPPTLNGAVLATIPAGEIAPKKFITVDVTAAVIAALQGGNSFGFAIETNEPLARIILSSKEGPAAGYSAQLDIEANLADNGSGTVSADYVNAGTLTGSTLVTNNIALPNTTGSTGIIYSGTVPVFAFNESKLNFFLGKAGNFTMPGGYNIAIGPNALDSNSVGAANLAIGYNSLTNNTGGGYNTAVGSFTMVSNTTGNENTAYGYHSLANNSIGSFNTAVGKYALLFNRTVSYNTGVGFEALYANETGTNNTATGAMAMRSNFASDNTAHGFSALKSNVSGTANTAVGSHALVNSLGHNNTAVGTQALGANTSGSSNTAIGNAALSANLTGTGNTAVGDQSLMASLRSCNCALGFSALKNTTTGDMNVAAGAYSLYLNTTGRFNTAIGHESLRANTTGLYNTAAGYDSLLRNTNGYQNSALGMFSLGWNTSGTGNTALGYSALNDNSSGSYNTALGYFAGSYLTTGSYNLAICHNGVDGENGTIRIGDSAHQNRTFIAGIRGITTGVSNAIAVMIDSNGQLGTVSSSRRYKEDIQEMGEASSRLLALRPVTFRYKKAYEDGQKPVQFGLIAEEVAQAFPELAVFNEQGQPETVKYQEIAAILLNEFIKDHRRADQQAQSLAKQQEIIDSQSKLLAQYHQELASQKAEIQQLTSHLMEINKQVDRIARQRSGNDPVSNKGR